MGAKFREKRKLPSEINFVPIIRLSLFIIHKLAVLNFVTQGTVTKVTKFGTPRN